MCCNVFAKEMNSQYNKTFPNLPLFHRCPTQTQLDRIVLADFQSLKQFYIDWIIWRPERDAESSIIYISKI